DTVISPNDKKSAVPPLVFVYFDPAKEQYVTLRSDAVPIQVQGGSSVAAASPASTAAPSSATAPSAPPAAATPPPRDILYQLTDLSFSTQTFEPVFFQRSFWMLQLVPLFGLFALAGWKIRKARLENRDARRIAALQHEMHDVIRRLRRGDASPNEYFPDASRLVQLKTALARNVDPNLVDMETAARTFDLDEEERRQLRQIFEQSDELRYSGGGNGNGSVAADQRREILRFIEGLRA
ncbi:MAG TPA: hypothetical protein VGM62_16755, partial [Chthoniobacterales bacterium]